jgi:hypothetical protein
MDSSLAFEVNFELCHRCYNVPPNDGAKHHRRYHHDHLHTSCLVNPRGMYTTAQRRPCKTRSTACKLILSDRYQASFLTDIFQHVSLNQANESMVNALKAVQKARDDFKEMEDTSATTIEALWRLRQVGKDMREIHQALVEMSDIFDQQAERQLSRTFPINSGGAR